MFISFRVWIFHDPKAVFDSVEHGFPWCCLSMKDVKRITFHVFHLCIRIAESRCVMTALFRQMFVGAVLLYHFFQFYNFSDKQIFPILLWDWGPWYLLRLGTVWSGIFEKIVVLIKDPSRLRIFPHSVKDFVAATRRLLFGSEKRPLGADLWRPSVFENHCLRSIARIWWKILWSSQSLETWP